VLGIAALGGVEEGRHSRIEWVAQGRSLCASGAKIFKSKIKVNFFDLNLEIPGYAAAPGSCDPAPLQQAAML